MGSNPTPSAISSLAAVRRLFLLLGRSGCYTSRIRLILAWTETSPLMRELHHEVGHDPLTTVWNHERSGYPPHFSVSRRPFGYIPTVPAIQQYVVLHDDNRLNIIHRSTRICGHIQIKPHLQIQPEFRRRAQGAGQSQRGVRSHRGLSVDQTGHAIGGARGWRMRVPLRRHRGGRGIRCAGSHRGGWARILSASPSGLPALHAGLNRSGTQWSSTISTSRGPASVQMKHSRHGSLIRIECAPTRSPRRASRRLWAASSISSLRRAGRY